MRIQPVLNIYNAHLGQRKVQTIFESNMTPVQQNGKRRYTGIASIDLAYASMIDKAIAEDLKFMKLI